MTLSRLELGFESPWGRQNNTDDTVECRNLPRKPKNQGFAVFCWCAQQRTCVYVVKVH